MSAHSAPVAQQGELIQTHCISSLHLAVQDFLSQVYVGGGFAGRPGGVLARPPGPGHGCASGSCADPRCVEEGLRPQLSPVDVFRGLRKVGLSHAPADLTEFVRFLFVRFSSTFTTAGCSHYAKAAGRRARPGEAMASIVFWQTSAEEQLLRTLYCCEETDKADVPDPLPSERVAASALFPSTAAAITPLLKRLPDRGRPPCGLPRSSTSWRKTW